MAGGRKMSEILTTFGIRNPLFDLKMSAQSLKTAVLYDGTLLDALTAAGAYDPQRWNRTLRSEAARMTGWDTAACRIVRTDLFHCIPEEESFTTAIPSPEGAVVHLLPADETRTAEAFALEMLEICLQQRFDAVALIAADAAYVPLVRKLERSGIPVLIPLLELPGPGGEIVRTARELTEQASRMFRAGINRPDGHETEVSEVLSLRSNYGFIKYPNNNLFFHHRDVKSDFFDLHPGDTVEFVIGRNDEGKDVAKQVTKIKL